MSFTFLFLFNNLHAGIGIFGHFWTQNSSSLFFFFFSTTRTQHAAKSAQGLVTRLKSIFVTAGIRRTRMIIMPHHLCHGGGGRTAVVVVVDCPIYCSLGKQRASSARMPHDLYNTSSIHIIVVIMAHRKKGYLQMVSSGQGRGGGVYAGNDMPRRGAMVHIGTRRKWLQVRHAPLSPRRLGEGRRRGRAGERWGGGGCILDAMHGCSSRMTIDPCIPTMPVRSTSGFSTTRQRLPAPSAKHFVEVLGESHER